MRVKGQTLDSGSRQGILKGRHTDWSQRMRRASHTKSQVKEKANAKALNYWGWFDQGIKREPAWLNTVQRKVKEVRKAVTISCHIMAILHMALMAMTISWDFKRFEKPLKCLDQGNNIKTGWVSGCVNEWMNLLSPEKQEYLKWKESYSSARCLLSLNKYCISSLFNSAFSFGLEGWYIWLGLWKWLKDIATFTF